MHEALEAVMHEAQGPSHAGAGALGKRPQPQSDRGTPDAALTAVMPRDIVWAAPSLDRVWSDRSGLECALSFLLHGPAP